MRCSTRLPGYTHFKASSSAASSSGVTADLGGCIGGPESQRPGFEACF